MHRFIMTNCNACVFAITERLKALGLTEEEFVELYSVIDTASGMNTTVNATGITPELLLRVLSEEGK
jgi:alkylhydroperoxidase family enzyme